MPATPVIAWPGGGGTLKLETLQVTGAYKVRGAYNALAARCERGDRRVVFAASAGNHGQGVAWAARRLGLTATIVVPRGAVAAKVAACRALGAEVVEHGTSVEDCVQNARGLAAERGAGFVHPFDDAEVIAGQGTVGWELALTPDPPDLVLVPVGGGGLAAGVSAVLASRGIAVVGVQVEGVDALRRARAGLPPQALAATVADGVRVGSPGALSSRLCAAGLRDIVTVTEAEVRATMRDLAVQAHLVVEGAGAVAPAALRRYQGFGACRAVAVASGGNVDPALLAALLAGV